VDEDEDPLSMAVDENEQEQEQQEQVGPDSDADANGDEDLEVEQPPKKKTRRRRPMVPSKHQICLLSEGITYPICQADIRRSKWIERRRKTAVSVSSSSRE
jgi:hypothetical protein